MKLTLIGILIFSCNSPDRSMGFTNWSPDGKEYKFFLGTDQAVQVVKDLDKGRYWLKKGADQNHADSQFFYGLSFLQHAKKPDEFLKAYFYLEKAKSNGSTYSQELNAHN